MDLNDAITAHAQWKLKLRSAITQQATIDVASLRKDNCCELGKWLQGEGKKRYGSLSQFADTVSKHAAFHQAAGAVGDAINAKNFPKAEALLAGGSAFSQASNEVGSAVIRLKRVVGG